MKKPISVKAARKYWRGKTKSSSKGTIGQSTARKSQGKK